MVLVWSISLLFSTLTAHAQSNILSPHSKKTAYEIGDIIVSSGLVTEGISSTSELEFSNKTSAEIIRDLLHHTHGVATLSNALNSDDIIAVYGNYISKHGSNRDKSTYELYKLYLTTVDLSNTQKIIYPQLKESLTLRTESEDWFVANTAKMPIKLSLMRSPHM